MSISDQVLMVKKEDLQERLVFYPDHLGYFAEILERVEVQEALNADFQAPDSYDATVDQDLIRRACPEDVNVDQIVSERQEHKDGIKVEKSTNQSKMDDFHGKEVNGLATHHKVDHGEDLHKCPECPKIWKTKPQLQNHMRDTHVKKLCEYCGIMISVKRLHRHIQQAHVNPEERRFRCDICGKGFTERIRLKDHINTHTGDRPYLCNYCGKGFANQANQVAHIRQVHLGKKRNTNTGEHLCTFCGKVFANLRNQQAHVRQVHLGQKRIRK